MKRASFFWNYFRATGNIGAYLLYKEINNDPSLSEYQSIQTRRSLG